MATLPEASVTLDESAGAFAGAGGYCVVMGCVRTSADTTPRVFSSTKGMLDLHNYAPALDYCALHFLKTRRPVIFVGLPITTQGAVGAVNNTGVTGSSTVTVSAGSGGCMDELNGSFTITAGGTVGTDQIAGLLSLDGGVSSNPVRVGTASSYAIPFVNTTINFGGGSLNVGDVVTFKTTAPMWGLTAIAAARAALASQQNLARTWMVIGDVTNSTFAGYVLTEANNYDTANQRFVFARAQVSDRLPVSTKSQTQWKMTGTNSLTFAASGYTITRAAGSWIADGFAVGDVVTVAGSASNNGAIGAITVLTATVMTFGSGVVNEGPTAAPSVTGSEGLTFDGTGHTITRTRGNWLNEGFAVGQVVTVAGTSSNNGATPAITVLTATVMTFGSGLVNEGPDASSAITMTSGQTMSAWVASQTAAFASIDGAPRIDLGLGRATVQSPIVGHSPRRPCQWAVSTREYAHDVQIPTYRKDDGPLQGFDIVDANGNTVEFDERFDGGGLAGRFTCLRSYGNGPAGAFVALSLTRDTEGNLLSRSHNMAVADLAETVVQASTENAIGQVLQLNGDGTGTDASLALIEQRVNRDLQVNLLQNFKEGPRASSAVWTASRTGVLSTPGSTLNGTLALNLNGTLENIATTVRVS